MKFWTHNQLNLILNMETLYNKTKSNNHTSYAEEIYCCKMLTLFYRCCCCTKSLIFTHKVIPIK